MRPAHRHRWGLPLLGRPRPHSLVFLATGFGDNIFTLGTVAALAVTEVLGRQASWTDVYGPAGCTTGGASSSPPQA
jgi:hypothetical protein